MFGRIDSLVQVLMSIRDVPRRRLRQTSLLLMFAAVLVFSSAIAAAGLRHRDAEALASCLQHANTAEELSFLSQLQAWRDQNIAGSYQLTLSGPLNAAAAGYAQYLANTPGAAGHYADGSSGYPWAARAVNCGYPSDSAAGGEGLAVVESSAQVSISPSQALTIMTSERQGGVWVPSSVGPAVKCVGVAKMVSSSGNKVAWVTLLFGTWDGTCAQAMTGGGGASPTASSTSTASPANTATSTPAKTPTPSPTPNPNYGGTITIDAGWNLVTLPAGPITDILDTAQGCFEAVYQYRGDQWLRYSPLVPAYANNLVTSAGGAFWIKGTGAKNCASIRI